MPLRDPATFRYIRQPVPRLDVRDKSTGRAIYAIDQKVEGMLYAAVQHAPRLGTEPDGARQRGRRSGPCRACTPSTACRAPSRSPPTAGGGPARPSRRCTVDWSAAEADGGLDTVAADFSSDGMLAALKAFDRAGRTSPRRRATSPAAFAKAAKVVEADYDAPYLAHAQLEPPSAIARFDGDGTLDVWLPNQMPEVFQAVSAKVAGLQPDQVRIHSPMLGGFFGRHFTYGPATRSRRRSCSPRRPGAP